jgi:putative membrane protein
MKRSWSATLSWIGVFTVVLGVGIAAAQQGAPSAPAGEREFVSQLAMSNMAAIQLGHLATKKAMNADVQKFAKSTIDDRLKAQQQLADAAYGAGIKWPTKLDGKYQQVQERLSKLNSEQFDREYMKATIDQHRDFERMLAARVTDAPAAQSGGAPLAAKVNQWAATTLPEVRAHLKEAEQVSGQLEKAE